MKQHIIAIRRDDRFSPNSIGKDKAILKSVIDRLDGDIMMIDEAKFTANDEADIYLSMGRLPQTISILKAKEDEGARVINSGYGVEACCRSNLDKLMREHNLPIPSIEGTDGYWIKRGDAAAQSKDDIIFCPNKAALDVAKADFAKREISNLVVSAHAKGDLIKFYGVQNGFFRYYYPTDDEQYKFGHEVHNGAAHHYKFYLTQFRQTVNRLAKIVGVSVFGGDAIIDSKGSFSIIDFNDWPSFSRCRDDAAEAINKFIRYTNGKV